MMRLRYDEDLVESVVFLCSTGRRAGVPPMQVARFNREREKLYSILDPDQRNTAFFRLHLDWFLEWGLEKVLGGLVSEFSLLPTALGLLAFRKARGKGDEGAELYVSAETGRNAVVAVRPERFESDGRLRGFMRRELMHLQDMVDPAFGYSPDLHLPGQTPARQRLTRERYRLLWDITIDGRLANSGRGTMDRREQHRILFDRAYGFWSAERREDVFETLWQGRTPQHGALVALASDPREVISSHAPLPGACCPLCCFPTFRWADSSQLSAPVLALISREFPRWTPEQGLCGRCLAVYGALLAPRGIQPMRMDSSFQEPTDFVGLNEQQKLQPQSVPEKRLQEECKSTARRLG